MIGLNNKYIIRFIIFEENKDILIINRLIKDGNLNNYEIIQRNNPLEIIDEITKNERHLCLRYHAHIICYLYKLQFLSFPITNKTRAFTEDHDIKYSFNVNEMLDLIISQNIKFKNLEFNFDVLNKFFTINNFTPTTIKSISIWSIFNEIYTNFIKILNNKNNIIDNNNLNYYINYISDQIEFKDSCPHYVFVPNAVSPNEDRLNDLFTKVWNFTPKDYKFTIFNRWGELLFETLDINAGWDCKFKGDLVEQDVYVYKITYYDTDKKWYEIRGTFFVVR